MTAKEAIKRLKRHGNDQENVMELYDAIEDEIFDLKHNYNVIKKMHDNSADYGAKIQGELNELKRNVVSFLKLVAKPTWLNFVESTNYDHLKNKLSKVGKEE